MLIYIKKKIKLDPKWKISFKLNRYIKELKIDNIL